MGGCSACGCTRLVLGLMYGLYVASSRFMQISKKLITFKLASIVTSRFRLLKMALIFFFKMSTCLGEDVVVASPSSLYNPTFMPNFSNLDKM